MILEDLHTQFESSDIAMMDVVRKKKRAGSTYWSCKLWSSVLRGYVSREYGEGAGPTLAEALERALVDLAERRNG